jgi:hypothetical protein
MGVQDSIEDAFINRLLSKVLEGNTGSNILGAVILAVQAGHINYAQAIQGFQFNNLANATESASLVGTLIVGVFAYFVGKNKKA